MASLVAYVTAQKHYVWAYHFWKKFFNGKHLWIRNNASTGVSQIIDSVIFATIAFYGVIPVMPIIVSTIVVKFIIAALDTPFLYAIRWYFEKVEPAKLGLPVNE
ncbi:MAG: queuosine precursor transporter [bacterium]|nr:queuosine precursor transporter [bacterium]